MDENAHDKEAQKQRRIQESLDVIADIRRKREKQRRTLARTLALKATLKLEELRKKGPIEVTLLTLEAGRNGRMKLIKVVSYVRPENCQFDSAGVDGMVWLDEGKFTQVRGHAKIEDIAPLICNGWLA